MIKYVQKLHGQWGMGMDKQQKNTKAYSSVDHKNVIQDEVVPVLRGFFHHPAEIAGGRLTKRIEITQLQHKREPEGEMKKNTPFVQTCRITSKRI